MRGDLAPGLQAAQAVHAALEFAAANPEMIGAWLKDSNYLVIVQVDDEQALAGLIRRAVLKRIPHHTVVEPDLGDEMTALALAPGDAARRLCASLPLAMREPAMV